MPGGPFDRLRTGPYELVDNNAYGSHREALTWLSATYPSAPLAVATGFVGLGGLHTLALLAQAQPRPVRLLLGAAPAPGAMPAEQAPEAEPAVRDQFQQSLDALRRERDFQSFPPLRRAMLEGVAALLRREDVGVRRYTKRFLHGKAYLLGQRNELGGLNGAGAALVSSANLTSAGLTSNLELGLVQYQPNVVRMALDWYEGLWAQADEFKDELLDLLLPVLPETDPQTVFLRALLELYGDDLPTETDVRPGEGLTRFQRDGYERARRILERYHGVVYADGVGTGKTEIGVEFVKDYARQRGLHTLVISPAQLRDRLWEKRLDEANLPGQVVSFQELAMDRQLVPDRAGTKKVLAVDKETYRLVIVDEAHAFRNADTYWYEALDRLMGGEPKDLVLLTATPVNNSLWDIHSLLLLFGRHDGAFGKPPLRIRSLRKFFFDVGANDPENISEVRLFPLIDAVAVRRDRPFLEKHYPNDHFPDGTPVRFPKPQLMDKPRYDLDAAYPGIVREIVKAIESLTMARYRPSAYLRDNPREAADEDALAGLIKSGLLKRFESSWRAALQTAQRMRDANAIVVESLRQHGAVPPLSSLWMLADEVIGGATLGDVVAEALTQDGALPAEAFIDKFLADVDQDLAILHTMASHLERLSKVPDPKLAELRDRLTTTLAKKVAIFTAYADSARYLKEALEGDRGLAGGRRWTVVIGNETDANARDRELERFCPESVTGDPKFKPAGGEVDLLISTDILSEGQNLQQAQAVISWDMPWNPQRVVQRNGRIIRLKSPHSTAYLYTLLPKQGDLELMLGLEARLRAKIAAANASFGMETPVVAGVPSVSKVYADLKTFTDRLAQGDATLLDEDGGSQSGAFAGEEYRARLRRALAEGEVVRLRALPWGIGAAFVPGSHAQLEHPLPAVFFACRTRDDDRYWRMVFADGHIERGDLEMLRLIDPGDAPGCAIPDAIDLEALFHKAAEDICQSHNGQADRRSKEERLPASQQWALQILRDPQAPHGREYDEADEALGVGRDALVRRALSELRKAHGEDRLSIVECAHRIVEVVRSFGLQPVKPLPPPHAISKDDLGVVCYQVVLPR